MSESVETSRAMTTKDVQDDLEKAPKAADWDGPLARRL
jgi:hypothetical protein